MEESEVIGTAEEFLQLLRSDSPEESRSAVTRPTAPGVLLQVANIAPSERVWVVRNKSVPPELLAELAGDSDVDVRFSIASKRRVTADVLRRLARDPEESVRAQVARNKNTDTETLQRLSSDALGMVRSEALDALARRSESH